MKNKIQIQHYLSPCGELLLGSLGEKLCLCNWTKEKHPGRVDKRLQTLLKAEYEEKESAITQEAARQLNEYFRHERKQFTVPLLFAGTDFQKSVWQKLLEIPYGQTISYGEMAKRLGMPQSVQPMPSLSLPLATGSSEAMAPLPDSAEASRQNVFYWNGKAIIYSLKLGKTVILHVFNPKNTRYFFRNNDYFRKNNR